MSNSKKFEGDLIARNASFGVLLTRFNSYIVDSLLQGALGTLKAHGVPEQSIDIVYVPGAFELPLVAKRLAASQRYQALIALGAVIRGDTPHFEYVAGECAKGLSQVSLEFEIPIAFGVLTTNTIEQAIERAGTKAGNKGSDAALTALEMINLLKNLGSVGVVKKGA